MPIRQGRPCTIHAQDNSITTLARNVRMGRNWKDVNNDNSSSSSNDYKLPLNRK
jgi:hypothetical protein